MDRLKFRIWNKDDETYEETTSFDCVFIDNDGQLRISNYSDASERLEDYTDSYIIEQCTGLKDKNGNLIYEGDIVVKSDTNALGYGRIRECNVHWHIDWLGWAITTEYGDTYALGEYASEQYEIIGNIHEQKDNK